MFHEYIPPINWSTNGLKCDKYIIASILRINECEKGNINKYRK